MKLWADKAGRDELGPREAAVMIVIEKKINEDEKKNSCRSAKT